MALVFILGIPEARSYDRRYEDHTTIEGILFRNKDGGLRINFEGHAYPIKSASRTTQDGLDNLETGDYIVGTGIIEPEEETIWLDDIEMVGIQKFLGKWSDLRSRKRFNFRDFNSLHISANNRWQQLNYRLQPEKRNEWTIFLSTNTSVKVGTIRQTTSRLELEVIDLRSGRISEKYRLVKTSSK